MSPFRKIARTLPFLTAILAVFLCTGTASAVIHICTIGDYVWYDENRNGIQDAGESGIAEVTVNLKDSSGSVIATTATDLTGHYQFRSAEYCTGTYMVEVVPPDGYQPTVSNAGDAATDSNASPATVSFPTGGPYSNLTIDFGFMIPCSGETSGFVWLDQNRNGYMDANEPGISGVTVVLLDSNNAVRAGVVTDANGYYQFPGICAGAYTVQVDESTLPQSVIPGSSGTNPGSVTLTSDNNSVDNVDLGYKPPCTGKIGDFIWLDSNRNGVQDAGEPGIDGITVNLLDGSGAVLATTMTSAVMGQHGFYQFAGLCAGTYGIAVDETTLPQGYTPTILGGTGSAAVTDSNPNPSTVTLATDDSTDMTVDFGYKTPCTGTIGDFVWHDLNRNGIQDASEPGIDGVKLTLLDNSGIVVATAITGSGPANQHGYYQFTGICPGTYSVQIDESTLPPGFVPGIDAAPGSTPANDSNYSPAQVEIAEGGSDQTVDFGYISPCTGSIGDYVWHDLNRNGIQDADEPGLDGVVVKLKDTSGTVIATTTTDRGPMGADGYFRFTGLCAGAYIVEVDATTVPQGFTATTMNATGSTSSNDSDGSPATVILQTDDTTNLTVDFGYVNPCTGSIGSYVYQDLNHNRTQDSGEPGIDGVTVRLRDASNTIIRTTTTGIGPDGKHGYYQFTGICAGTYSVEAVTPPGYIKPVGSSDKPTTVKLCQDNTSNQSVNFGFLCACTGKIGNYVWYDKNRNGLQNACEQGIDGVTLKLRDSTGSVIATTTSGSGPNGARGYYQFTGVCAGTYTVEPVTPSGYQPTPSDVGRKESIDSDGSREKVVLYRNDSVNENTDFGYIMKPQPGCGTPGYWQNHPESWPVGQITIGGKTYTKCQAISLMKSCSSKDVTYTMFATLVAAKLNVMIGAKSYCVENVIEQADAWMAKYGPVGSGVRAGTCSSPWRTGQPLQSTLDDYNNGLLCAPSRESTCR